MSVEWGAAPKGEATMRYPKTPTGKTSSTDDPTDNFDPSDPGVSWEPVNLPPLKTWHLVMFLGAAVVVWWLMKGWFLA